MVLNLPKYDEGLGRGLIEYHLGVCEAEWDISQRVTNMSPVGQLSFSPAIRVNCHDEGLGP